MERREKQSLKEELLHDNMEVLDQPSPLEQSFENSLQNDDLYNKEFILQNNFH